MDLFLIGFFGIIGFHYMVIPFIQRWKRIRKPAHHEACYICPYSIEQADRLDCTVKLTREGFPTP